MFGFNASGSANRIYTLEVPGRKGVIGMVACPGVRIESPRRGNPQKNLKRDIAAMQEWDATGVVTLNETHELEDMGVPGLGEELQQAGFWWRQLPIVDMNIPSAAFEARWRVESQQIQASITAGERVIIHCLAGLGRTGLIAARLLVEMGTSPEHAILLVRKVRPRAIQTVPQEEYVRALKVVKEPRSRNDRWSRLHSRREHPAQPPNSQLKGFGT